MIILALRKALQGGRQGIWELEQKLQNLWKKKLVNQIIHAPETVQRWRNSQLKKLTPIIVASAEQAPTPLKRYVTGSNAIPLTRNQYLEQASHPAEPIDQSIRSIEASLEKNPNVITTVKATITKALQYSKSAKSLLRSKRCYKCKGTGHQAKNCSHRRPRKLFMNQDDDDAPSSTYQLLSTPVLCAPLPTPAYRNQPMPTEQSEERGRTPYRPT